MIRILEGDNSFLSKERLHFLINKYKEEKPLATIRTISAESTPASEIIRECQTQDIFSVEKILVIKRLLANKEYKDLAEKIYEDIKLLDNTNLIIWEDCKIPKNTRYYKNFNKENAIESFSKFNRRSFPTWAKEQLSLRNLRAKQNVLEDLIIMTNYDPYAFLNEIEKFKILEKEEICENDLRTYINSIHDYDIWGLIDAINQKNNRKEIIEIILKLFEKKVAPQYLIVMLARNLKQIILTNKLLKEEKADREIVSILKIPPFTLPKIKSIAQKSKYSDLINLYEKIHKLDYEIKIGNLDGEIGLVLLTTRF